MHLRVTDDVDEFAGVADDFLRRDPFSANVVAVEVEGVRSGRRALRPGSVWVLVEEDGGPVGCAMHTPPHNVFLPRLGDGVPEAIADELRRVGRAFPGVSGEVATVRRFCRRWEELGGPGTVCRKSMRMYALGTLRPPSGVPGRARRGLRADTDLVVAWLRSFSAET
ncbi:MAG TPA: hypothetical protein VEJ44_03105, partial [Acidimicrobiales bacterium]|nr:hypothetical protein [Acidimicrobiales bacterium]